MLYQMILFSMSTVLAIVIGVCVGAHLMVISGIIDYSINNTQCMSGCKWNDEPDIKVIFHPWGISLYLDSVTSELCLSHINVFDFYVY